MCSTKNLFMNYGFDFSVLLFSGADRTLQCAHAANAAVIKNVTPKKDDRFHFEKLTKQHHTDIKHFLAEREEILAKGNTLHEALTVGTYTQAARQQMLEAIMGVSRNNPGEDILIMSHNPLASFAMIDTENSPWEISEGDAVIYTLKDTHQGASLVSSQLICCPLP
jgi:hypothetical protein